MFLASIASTLTPLALLACPVGMGVMMWMMMRGQSKPTEDDTAAKQAELAALRAEVDQLQAARRDTRGAGIESHARLHE